ncbi:hypothetical protein HAX54_029411 [Datura stramonium]|uniref:Uncharacterized protein n=1 Tax=Datura stramonium TaxID=4076 RepID=A0ABS8V818_DATST|nr:hypothetical protein [Datura stramonium]
MDGNLIIFRRRGCSLSSSRWFRGFRAFHVRQCRDSIPFRRASIGEPLERTVPHFLEQADREEGGFKELGVSRIRFSVSWVPLVDGDGEVSLVIFGDGGGQGENDIDVEARRRDTGDVEIELERRNKKEFGQKRC